MRASLPALLAALLGALAAPVAAQRLSFGGVDVDPRRDLPVAPAVAAPAWRLVQFEHAPSQPERDALTARGLRVIQYYPDNAWLVWGDAAALERSAELSSVRWYGDLRPQWKRSPDLAARRGSVDNVALLAYDDGHADRLLAQIAQLGGRVLGHARAQPDGALWQAVIRIDAGQLDAIAALPAVLWLEHSAPRPSPDDEASSQIVAGNYTAAGTPAGPGYLAFLDALLLDGAGVTFAVTDTGVDYAHPELGPRIVGGYDYPGCESAPGAPGDDRLQGGHGTHVAGILAGAGVVAGALDGNGYHHGVGVAPAVDLVTLNPVCGSISQWPPAGGWQDLSQRALALGAIGSSNSWNSGEPAGTGYQASARAHDFMVRDGDFDAPGDQPFVMVFSAGNGGPGPSTITTPKEAKNLIVVGSALSSRPIPRIDDVAPGSSRGPALDGRILPTVVAPGDTIASTRRVGGASYCAEPIAATGANADYAYCSGTSMATPHVAGLAALLTQAWRQANAGATPSPALLKALLVNGAVDMAVPPPVPNPAEGWGRVHLTRSLGSGGSRVAIDQSEILDQPGSAHVALYRVADPTQPVRITLAWTDAPGAPGADPALVNDLDLEVETGGRLYHGNVFDGGLSISGGAADALNNLENVYLPPLPDRVISVRVRARALPGDGVPGSGDDTDQDFALVCSNCSDQPDYTLALAPEASAVCAGRPLQIEATLQPLLDYDDPVALSVSGWPMPGAATFDPNPMLQLPGTSVLSLDSQALPAGTYALTVDARSLSFTRSAQIVVRVDDQTPAAPIATAPEAGATDVPLTPTLRWSAVAAASDYLVQVATDPAFGAIVASGETGLPEWAVPTPLAAATDHYWRVYARNPCSIPELFGDGFEAPAATPGSASDARVFRTRP